MLFSTTYAAAVDANPMGQALCPKVYDSAMREIAELRVERVVHALGEPSRAEIAVVLDGYRRWKDGAGAMHEGIRGFEDAVPPGKVGLGLDDVVHVGLSLGGGQVLVIFRGRVSDVNVSASGSGESAHIVALGPEHALDNSDLRGARYADESSGVVDTDAPVAFNPDNLGNYDPAGSTREGRPLFGDPTEPDSSGAAPWAHHWRLGAFWRYVVGNCCPAGDARLPSWTDTSELSRDDDAVLPPTDVDGMRPSQALRLVLGAYGLDWWADPFAVVNAWSAWGSPLPSFRIVNPATAPVKSLKLQPRGEAFSKDATNVESAAMGFSTRGCVNHWRVEGDYREYEAAFELVPLWAADEQSQVDGLADKGNRSSEDYEPLLDHVRRQWGLNEDGAQGNRDAFDFAAFLGEGVWTKRRRRFFAPYSETDGDVRRCVVEVESGKLTSGWHRVGSGNVRLLTDRCGIYFDLADVDGTNACLTVDTGERLALEDVDGVRLSAIVKSDERVAYDAERMESAGASAEISRVLRDDGCRWVKRFDSSAYSADGTGIQRDDSAAGGTMEKLAKQAKQQSEAERTTGLSMAWVELSLRLGDRVSGVDGRGLSFADGDVPCIESLSWDFGSQTTGIRLRMPK